MSLPTFEVKNGEISICWKLKRQMHYIILSLPAPINANDMKFCIF